MNHSKLTDYQIAEAFGRTLSLIYIDKLNEINEELDQYHAQKVRLQIPQVPEFHRWFFEQSLFGAVQRNIDARNHITKIRKLWKNIKKNPKDRQFLNVEKARAVPIASLYDFRYKGKNVSCPFHDDKHPSASIKYNKLICFQCGYKGNSIDLFMKLNAVSFQKAVEELNRI